MVSGGQFDLTTTGTDLTIDSITCAAPFTCPAATPTAPGTFTVAFFDPGLQPVATVTDALTVNVTVGAGVAVNTMITLDVNNEQFGAGATMVAAVPAVDGVVNVQAGPSGAFTLTPATLNLSALQGGGAATGSITVANSGDADLAGVSCTYAGDAEITVAPFTTDLAAGASGTAAASCASAMAATYTGTYSCAAGAITGSSAVSCEVGPASAMAASTPATGSTITVSNVLAGGSSNGQILFAETNDQGVAYTVDSCAFTTGAAFAVTSTFPVAVAAGGSAAVGFSASAPADGTTPANDTLTCTTSTAQTFTFTTAITVRPPPPEVIPTLSQWAMMLMALVLAGFAGLSLRARKDFDV